MVPPSKKKGATLQTKTLQAKKIKISSKNSSNNSIKRQHRKISRLKKLIFEIYEYSLSQ